MVFIMVSSFLITLIISGPQWDQVVSGLAPRIPDGSEVLSIALVASSLSLVGAFFQSYLVQQKNWKIEEKQICVREGIAGIVMLGLISSIVLITGGSVLHSRGIEVRTAAELGMVLEPLFGKLAYGIFMLGLLAASFSSLIGNATLGGTILADTLMFDTSLQNRNVRVVIMVIISIGAIMAVMFREFGIDLIVMAQSFTVLLAPFVGLMILILSNDNQLMGSLRNERMMRLLGGVGLGLLFTLAIINIYLIGFTGQT
jgi:Mn2+/Fe2+ NRAMP family transporter